MLIQGTPEWLLARVGKVTASRVADVVNRIKSGAYSTSRQNYLAELLCERLTGLPSPSYTSAAMQWGKDNEDGARKAYVLQNPAAEVAQVGFVDHSEIDMSGASPDGLVDAEGLLEIKCPLTATHLTLLDSGEIDKDHITQMQWQMTCTGRLWCDYVSFDPRLPKGLDFISIRVPRDLSFTLELESEVAGFLAELDAREARLRSRCLPQGLIENVAA